MKMLKQITPVKSKEDIRIQFHDRNELETPKEVVEMLGELAARYCFDEVIIRDARSTDSTATFIDDTVGTSVDITFKKMTNQCYKSLFALNIELEEKLEFNLS